MTRYLSFEDILRQVDRVGFVVRDPGLLASAIARPETSVFGEDAYPTMWLKAAALCQSIDNNQALVDGNKRLAWLSTKVFLLVNGQRLESAADEGERFMLDLVVGHADLSAIADWLQDHSTDAEAPDLPGDSAP
ncbi:type II toxin-antitoxin system death-on-curing family toxin [uncultured Jatrophihabitans sp.]|uniref:type II toxin-antitoxin system death-on-curing family toxin n=1 Tax=uncultured Jatrophihabitans sp. TaxID=1610747 RepID=UPI0035C9E2B5